MRLSAASLTLPAALLLGGSTVHAADQNAWFFTGGCQDTSKYVGMSSPNELTCAAATTREIGGDETPGPWTNVVTENLEKLGMELTLWNDTGCQDLIIRIDTDGCHVVPANNRIQRVNVLLK